MRRLRASSRLVAELLAQNHLITNALCSAVSDPCFNAVWSIFSRCLIRLWSADSKVFVASDLRCVRRITLSSLSLFVMSMVEI